MSKPQKPNISFPADFAISGEKADFTQEKIQKGFDSLMPDVLAGDNLNKFISDVYKSMTYTNAGVADLYKSAVTYDEDETYNLGSIVFNTSDFGETKIYISKSAENQGQSLEDTNYWDELKLSGGGLEIGDIGTALYIDETKGKRRWLNGSVMSINANTQGFLNWLKKAVQAVPSLSTTETNWQAEASMSTYGQCGKFVINETEGTIRLPKVVNIQGLQDLTKAGVTVAAGLPSLSLSESGTHTHTGSTNSTGNHTHTITARRFAGNGYSQDSLNNPGWGFDNGNIQSAVSKTSSQNGNHSHTFTTASDGAHTHTITGAGVGKSNTVQPEAVQYQYFIQIATGQETEVDIVNEIELNNPYSLGDSKYSPIALDNTSWLASNGQWNSGAVYIDFYSWLLENTNAGKDLFKITEPYCWQVPSPDDYVYYTTTRTPEAGCAVYGTSTDKLLKESVVTSATADTITFLDEGGNERTATYKQQGLVSWDTRTWITDNDFAINTEEQTFRLPIFNGSEDLPSSKRELVTIQSSGSSYVAPANGWYRATFTSTSGDAYISLNNATASISTVQHVANQGNTPSGFIPARRGDTCTLFYEYCTTPSSMVFTYAKGNGTLYYYVGETVQNANLIDAGRISEQLATKLSVSQKQEITGWAFPSSSYTQLALPATNTYLTAIGDGYYGLAGEAITANVLCFAELTSNVNGKRTMGVRSIEAQPYAGTDVSVFLPVSKGQTVWICYNNFTVSQNYMGLYFVPAKGAQE